jgi:hypothetical protein
LYNKKGSLCKGCPEWFFAESDAVILFHLLLETVASVCDQSVVKKVCDDFLSKHLIIVGVLILLGSLLYG